MVASTNTDNLVRPEDACPGCGERDADRLIWQDDDRVRCATCGTEYAPGVGGDSHATPG